MHGTLLKMVSKFLYLYALGFGLGKSPVASGTVASAATVIVAFIWWNMFPLSLTLLAISIALGIALTLTGIHASTYTSKVLNIKDPKEVVIDEIAAQWLVCITSPAVALYTNQTDIFSWKHALLAFFLFRIFDIFKPGPIGWCDKNLKDGFGIMLDDTLAAVASVVCILIGHWVLGIGHW